MAPSLIKQSGALGFIAAYAFLCWITPLALAQDKSPLEIFSESRQLSRVAPVRRLRSTEERLTPSLQRAFFDQNSARTFTQLIHPSENEYRYDRPGRTISSFQVTTWVRFAARANPERQYNVSITIPHPNYYTLYEKGLIPEIAEMFPPKLPAREEKESVLENGYPVKLFLLPKNFCHAVVELSPPVLVEVRSTKPCRNYSELLAFTNQLKIDRLYAELFPEALKSASSQPPAAEQPAATAATESSASSAALETASDSGSSSAASIERQREIPPSPGATEPPAPVNPIIQATVIAEPTVAATATPGSLLQRYEPPTDSIEQELNSRSR